MIEIPPTSVILRVLPHLIGFLMRLGQVQVGPSLRLSSWYRDFERNVRAGGLPQSQHLLGLAIDVTGDARELENFALIARGVGLVPVGEQSHLHIQFLPAGRAATLGLFRD